MSLDLHSPLHLLCFEETQPKSRRDLANWQIRNPFGVADRTVVPLGTISRGRPHVRVACAEGGVPMTIDPSLRALRDRISRALTEAFLPLPAVLAGWEGGSVAFGTLDGYSDIDLNFVVADDASADLLHAAAESALETVSPITGSHPVPPGRYYKLREGGEFLLVDLCFFRAGAADQFLEVERHGQILPLFDKADWLRQKPLDEDALAAKRDHRYRELRTWFPMSQCFVRKAILRGQHAEAVTAFWAYTMKPLAELLRIRFSPVRWDFGMRYLDRDLPPAIYDQVRDLAFVRDLGDLEAKLARATAWGEALLKELDSV